MKKSSIIKMSWGIIFTFALIFSACRSAIPVDFYTLSPLLPVEVHSNKGVESRQLTVGIGKIRLPEYLDRPQIVTLKGPHRLHLAEFHRWAGRLDGEIAQAMGQNLGSILGLNRVVIYHWDSFDKPDMRVDLDFYHFEGELGESVHLQGIWRLTGSGLKGGADQQPFDLNVRIKGAEYKNLVEAFAQGLWELSRIIGERVENV